MIRIHPYLAASVLLLWTCAALAAGAAVVKTRPAKMRADPPVIPTSEPAEPTAVSVYLDTTRSEPEKEAPEDLSVCDYPRRGPAPCWCYAQIGQSGMDVLRLYGDRYSNCISPRAYTNSVYRFGLPRDDAEVGIVGDY